MVGGEESTFQQVKPILDCFTENIDYIGNVGSGHRLKLVNNYISMGFTSIVISALAYAEMLEVDLERMNEVMSKGSNYVPAMLLMINWFKNKNNVLQFSIGNAFKDLNYFQQILNYDHSSAMHT